MQLYYYCNICIDCQSIEILYKYSQTCLFRTPWDPKNCPDDRGVLISQVHLYTFILQWDHN